MDQEEGSGDETPEEASRVAGTLCVPTGRRAPKWPCTVRGWTNTRAACQARPEVGQSPPEHPIARTEAWAIDHLLIDCNCYRSARRSRYSDARDRKSPVMKTGRAEGTGSISSDLLAMACVGRRSSPLVQGEEESGKSQVDAQLQV